MQNQLNILDIKNPNQQFKNCTFQQLELVKKIYKTGELCEVQLVNYQNNQYAMKVIFKDRIQAELYPYEYRRVYNQISILYHLDSPNIIKLFWHGQDKNAIYLLMEFGGIRLATFVKKNIMDQTKIKNICKQVFEGVKTMHSQNFIHRDIALQNIVIQSQTLQVKLIDFGYSQQTYGGRKTKLGIIQNMAPQIYYQKTYNSKADIWSLGIVLYQLFNKKNPFASEGEPSEQQFIQKRDKLKYVISQEVSADAADLIKKMLVISPQKRLSIDQILRHKWIRDQQQQQDMLEYFVKRSSEDRKTQLYKNQGKQALSQNQNQQSVQEQQAYDMQSSVNKLQKRLKQLTKRHSIQLYKKKRLILELISLEKATLQK